MKLLLLDGKEYEFAPLRFTPEACELLEAQESLSEDGKFGSFARVLRVNVLASLVNGGLTPEEAEKAVQQVPMQMKEDGLIAQILKAMLGE